MGLPLLPCELQVVAIYKLTVVQEVCVELVPRK